MKKVEFNRGVVYAAARLIEIHDEPVIAMDIIHESGISRKEMMLCCGYDLAFLRKADNDIPKGKD